MADCKSISIAVNVENVSVEFIGRVVSEHQPLDEANEQDLIFTRKQLATISKFLKEVS